MCDPRPVTSRRRPTGLYGAASPRPPVLYRACIVLARFLARYVFGLRMTLEGREHLPVDARGRRVGGWIAAPMAHRSWIDPFVEVVTLPLEPRTVFFGDGRVIFFTPFRRLLFRVIGGVVPVWPRGGRRAFFEHLDAAARVVGVGAVFVIHPEATSALPPPGRVRTVQPGVGYLALRTGAPVVPMLLGGTSDLYRGRRLTLRVLPAITVHELADLPPGKLPERDSPEERAAARRIAERLEELMTPLVAERYQRDVAESANDRRRWRWLNHWLDLEWEGDRARKRSRDFDLPADAAAPESSMAEAPPDRD